MHHAASHGQEFVVLVGRLAIVGHRLLRCRGRLPLLIPQLLQVLLVQGLLDLVEALIIQLLAIIVVNHRLLLWNDISHVKTARLLLLFLALTCTQLLTHPAYVRQPLWGGPHRLAR